MAKEKNTPQDKSIPIIDKMSKGILSLLDTSYTERSLLSAKDAKFQSILNREMNITKGVSKGSVVDFIATLRQDQIGYGNRNKSTPDVDSSDLFTKDIGDIFGYFQDVYKNRFIEMTDLKFISKFIPAIGEAVKITLESIVSSDDVSCSITRNIDMAESVSENDKAIVIAEVEKLEKELKLLRKLKNVVYRKTLVTGSFYVYAIAYSEIFDEYDHLKAAGLVGGSDSPSNRAQVNKMLHMKSSRTGYNISQESSTGSTSEAPSLLDAVTIALESQLGNDVDAKDLKKIKSVLSESIPTITIQPESITILSYALEAAQDMDALKKYEDSFPGIRNLTKKDTAMPDNVTSDGTIDIATGSSSTPTKRSKYSDISGTYVKYIDSKNIIPLKVFDKTIGYYHIHTQSRKKSQNGANAIASLGNSLFSSTNLTEQKKENAVTNIVNTISEGIMSQFTPKFANDHVEYKQMIADCIIANGIVDNDYQIQFIPAEHIVEFKINEDENGNGESILADALFPAKLLLSLIICKMLTYMNKSGNKTIAHVYKGPIDVNSHNQVQRVTRQLQESNITFNDLLSTNMVFSKFTRDANIQLPRAKNGEKLVEFETQEGQQVDMHTDFEDKLEQMAILGTGVPTVIMEFTNQADFAKQLDSANIRYAGRIASLQTDLEDPTTELYKILLTHSGLSNELKQICLSSLEFKLPRPKVLKNNNDAEFLTSLVSLADAAATIVIGQSKANDENSIELKDELMRLIVRERSPFFNWNEIDKMLIAAQINVNGIPKNAETSEM